MMTKKDKEKAIRNGVKHMFNKTLPSDVYDALQVPVEFRTRKHWRSIRFVTDTMSAFSKFPVALKDHLSKVLTLRNCHLNTYICHEGDEADNYYVNFPDEEVQETSSDSSSEEDADENNGNNVYHEGEGGEEEWGGVARFFCFWGGGVGA